MASRNNKARVTCYVGTDVKDGTCPHHLPWQGLAEDGPSTSSCGLYVPVLRLAATSSHPIPRCALPFRAGENGRHCPGPLYRRLLAEVLETTETDLGFGSAGRPDPTPPLPAGPELLAYLETVLASHIQAGRTIGSYYLISVVQEHVKVMELCLHDTRSRLRDDFLSLANRFAEFCGWLNQDQRRYADAERWGRRPSTLLRRSMMCT